MIRSVERVLTLGVGIFIGAATMLVIGNFSRAPDGSTSVEAHAAKAAESPPPEEIVNLTAPANANPQTHRIEESIMAPEDDFEPTPTGAPINLPDIYEQHINPAQRSIRFADIHNVFKNELRDESWAAAMEAGLIHSIANSASSEFVTVEYLECRSRMCEIAGYLLNEEAHSRDLLTNFERSGVWSGRFSTHTSRFSNTSGKRFITIVNGYTEEEYQSIFLEQ